MHFVVSLEVFALLDTRVAAHGTDIHHAVPELDEGAALDGDIEAGDVDQDPVHELFVCGFAEPGDERGRGEGDAHAEGCETVLGEREVEEGGYREGGGAELFLLFDEVGAADEADGAFVAEGGEEGEHFGGYGLWWGGRVG